METIVYPDAVRGIVSLLRGVEIAGYPVRPELFVPVDYTDHKQPVVVHVQQANAVEGSVDRVQEVRITVYGHQPLASQDITEAVLSLITGDGVTTPATDSSAEFYFDSIRQRVGPSMLDWPTDQVFPASASVDCRARPLATP